MFILDVTATCNSPVLASTLAIVKNVLLLIQIIVPILLIVYSSIGIFQLMQNPDKKGGAKPIINKFIAAAIVFFIPVLMNVVLGLVGENTNFSSCWNNAGSITGGGGYIDPYDNGNKKVIGNTSDYK